MTDFGEKVAAAEKAQSGTRYNGGPRGLAPDVQGGGFLRLAQPLAQNRGGSAQHPPRYRLAILYRSESTTQNRASEYER